MEFVYYSFIWIILILVFAPQSVYITAKRAKDARLTLKTSHKKTQLLLGSSKIKLGEVYLSGIDGLRGEKGARGPPGRRGPRGLKGSPGEKGESCTGSYSGFASVPSGPCIPSLEGVIKYDRTSGYVQICIRGQWQRLQGLPMQQMNNIPRKSCLDVLFHGESRGDGMYWINPNGGDRNKNSFRAYCDMSTAGGGWTLVAKITDDYSWVCPNRGGSICLKSDSDPSYGNLFHSVHQRDSIDLSITHDIDAGIHLNNSIIRQLFANGRQSIRFSFVTDGDGWSPSEDAYAVFHPGRSNSLFLDGSWAAYNRTNMDYTWNIIKHIRRGHKFQGGFICWGNRVKTSYRYYDHGLHVGSPAKGDKPCLLDSNENEVMLKSHYALIQDSQARWDMAQFGFLGAKYVQAKNKRIALWVR